MYASASMHPEHLAAEWHDHIGRIVVSARGDFTGGLNIHMNPDDAEQLAGELLTAVAKAREEASQTTADLVPDGAR